jgi:hypothetical protein
VPRPLKIVALELEEQALAGRNAGKTLDELRDRLNALLKKRGSREAVTVRAIERYWATLDRASVVPAHQPQLAERNADVGMKLGREIQQLHHKLHRWLDEAEDAKSATYDSDGSVISEDVDWRARTSVAREFRETLRFTAEMLERIYNVEQIRVFQQTVLETIGDVSPEMQRDVKRRFEANQQVVRAKLLGLEAESTAAGA